MQTITRKFLVKDMPDLSGLQKTSYNRFYLYIGEDIIIRVQNVGNKYELERKVDESNLVRDKQKLEITKQEFDFLSKLAVKNTVRDSHTLSERPVTKLRIYHGKYEGLIRVEVSFETIEEAESFKSSDWFGKEITSSPLAQDKTLLDLSESEFKKLLEN